MSSHCFSRMLPLWMVPVLLCGSAATAVAQIAPGEEYRSQVRRFTSPYDAITSRVYAQAELLRAGGAADVDHATARRLRAEAVRQEIANSVERVRAHWERKAIGEAEVLKRHRRHLTSLKLRNSRTWDRVKNHPEFNGPGTTNGRLLNFLLHRLSGTVLAYEYSRSGEVDDATLKAELSLSPEVISGLQLKQRGTNGQEHVFRADEGLGLQVDFWPVALREAYFDSLRGTFQNARQQLVSESRAGGLSRESMQKLDEALLKLRNSFDDHYSRSRRFENGMHSWHSYHTARLFLNSLAGEVGRLKATGSTESLDGSLRFRGDNLIELLQFMSRSGLEFAPARPGEEKSYFTLAAMMRDVYITVADDDESLKFNRPNPANLPRSQLGQPE